jgi:hypothetical protein
MYWNTTDNHMRMYSTNAGAWVSGATGPVVTPSGLAFVGHNYTTGSYTGQDGLLRNAGKITSPQHSYSGETFTSAFDGASNHVLVLRFLATGNAYAGLGVSVASSISNGQADNSVGSSYYGLGGDWTGASSVTHYGAYFNQTSSTPPYNITSGFLFIFTKGTGASRTLQILYGTAYTADYENGGSEVNGGGSTPSGGTMLSPSILPITIGTKDFALAVGEASDTYEWRIERYGTY